MTRLLIRAHHVYWILTILTVCVSVSMIIHGPGVVLLPWEDDDERRVRIITSSSTPMFYRPPLLDNIFGSNREIVVSVEIVAENRTIQHSYHEREAYYKTLPTWMDRYAFLPSPHQVPDDQRVCLVHVGKTAGSTLSCFLGFKSPKCQRQMRLLPGNLPKYTTNLIHVHRDSCRRETHIGLYLFTLRDPLHRLMSWFTYERPSHVRDYSLLSAHRRSRIYPLFVECGLTTISQLGEVMSDTNNAVCAQRAWRAVTGAQGYAIHNQMNYGYYWNKLPRSAQQSSRLAVIRTEHLEQDWYSVERVSLEYQGPIVADDDKNNSNASTPIFGKRNESVKQKQDTELSELARRNLCAGLCHEIQIYKRILRRAENLSPEDVTDSLRELEESCPLQAVARDCPIVPY